MQSNSTFSRAFVGCIFLFIAGALFYCWYNELIIIRLPFRRVGTPIEHTQSQRSKNKLIFFNGTSLITEEKEILSSTNILQTVNNLITSWLTLQEEERLMPKKVSVATVMIDEARKEVFISFDRNPLLKDKSIYEKLMWVEGLLKTLKENGLPLQTVRLLINGKPIPDAHLDFTHPWPLSGYLQ